MDGTLSGRLADQFLSGDKRRGREYFSRQQVTINLVSQSSVTASVRGSFGDPCAVRLDLTDFAEGSIGAMCECRRYQDGYNCKHIWATILQLEASILDPPDADELDQEQEVEGELDRDRQWLVLREHMQEDLPLSINNSVETHTTQDVQHWFLINLVDQGERNELLLRIFQSQHKANGQWTRPQRCTLSQNDVKDLLESPEQEIFHLLEAVGDPQFGKGYYHQYAKCDLFKLPRYSQDRLLTLLAETERFGWVDTADQTVEDVQTLAWADTEPWRLVFRISEEGSRRVQVAPYLQQGSEQRSLDDVVLAFADGWILFSDRLARSRQTDTKWVNDWKSRGVKYVERDELHSFLEEFLQSPNLPDIQIDDNVDIQQQRGTPVGKLVLTAPDYDSTAQLQVRIIFRYGEYETRPDETRNVVWHGDTRTVLLRDRTAEAKLMQSLRRFKFQTPRAYLRGLVDLRLHEKWLPRVVSELTAEGWEVIAHGMTMRHASAMKVAVSSGTDWFDLNALVDFEGVTVPLPQLLAAVKKKQTFVRLDDGTNGIVPHDWVARYARFAHVAVTEEGALRFSKSQALLLDALLAEQEHLVADRPFQDYCDRVQAFSGISPQHEPTSFQGELRGYQRDGLGWLAFLRDFDFGGCLADDMGIGKTVQVLAMLEERRTSEAAEGDGSMPSIVVVPKSLVFNWTDEAQRFAPQLKLADYTGPERSEVFDDLADCDLVITTYGILRRDIAKLKQIAFDYAILDESQAIKNANSQAAKAVRLLDARYRLAMTGTPIENHLGELWALFDFLNPGMLGKAAGFRKLTKTDENESLQWLNHTLKPFFLRRTKSQVLKELPEKTEQTLYCEMDDPQRQLYDELKQHYRVRIGRKVRDVGLGKSKMHVLEALLRLRQAACDPRLLDDSSEIVGVKIELLMEKLAEVMEEGHKALVFSQFTSLLALVRQQVEQREWDYEYLDGKTTKRETRVKRFQNDEAAQLFLISLKAGGHGLNLTAADYVFILDPWWNPAVEAQAIDRAHRIGQTRRVMAYRIICRDTVEDKIVKLQQSKQELADAIVSANESLISSLSTDDLQMLFD